MRMDQIGGALLNRAIDIYLQHAYRRHADPKRKVPKFEPGQKLPEVLAGTHPFEDLSGSEAGGAQAVPVGEGTVPRVYALRLGNDAYPHMKLALVEAYFKDEFVFSVDRHDTFHFEPDVPGYEAWCQLKEINRLLKEAIEDAWHKAGVPTLRGLREMRFKRTDLVRKMRAEGQRILILDDDEDRAEILKELIESAGYSVLTGPPGPKPDLGELCDTEAIEAVEKARASGHSVRLPAKAAEHAGDVKELCELIVQNHVALVILDVSYRTGQGPRVANALKLHGISQELPILAIYSRRDFGPDPDLFDSSLRRPYRTEALLELVEQILMQRSGSGSGIHDRV